MSREKSRNELIAEMLSDGTKVKDFYRFTAQNPHIDLHDACQIVIARPKASICFYIDEWNALGRKVTANRKGIQFYDVDGHKQFVFDLHDTHGEKRYRRLIFPMRRLLYGLDELNGTKLAESNRRDYSKILSGVASYLDESGYFTEDERRNSLIAEGVAYSLYSKTGFPKNDGIILRGMPYGLEENARLFKEIYLLTENVKEDIDAAYEQYMKTPKTIDDIEEETVSDEPALFDEPEIAEESVTQVEEISQGNAMYQRYMAAQKEKPEAVVLCRVGDFYEVLGDRAKEVADWLDLTLTGRDMGLSERVPMCGFPYHVTDTYIEKILEHRGVYLLEPDSEPMYILSHAEIKDLPEEREIDDALSQIQPDAEKLAELEELFESEFESEIEPEETENELFDVSEEWDEEEVDKPEDESEQGEPTPDKTLPNGEKQPQTKDKEKSIRERKRRIKPLPTLFDYFLPVPEKSRKEQLIEKQLLYGSGVQDGKYRIYDKYFTDPTIKDYANFLKREYGIGGYYVGQESQSHDGKGIRIEWRDREHPQNNICVDLKWNEVAVRIADLIDEGKYLTEEEKKDYEVRYKPAKAPEIEPPTSYNRFTALTLEDRIFYENFLQRQYREPSNSPWEVVQDCTVIAPGIYSVITAGHGGIMIDRALAPHILSPEALSEGFVEEGYYCYEEDAAACIPLRELYDKGILDKTNEYFTQLEYVSNDPDAEDEYRFTALTEAEQEEKLKNWNNAVNESLAHWYLNYWEAYQRAARPSGNGAANTDLHAVLDQSELGGAKARFQNNVEAIRLMKELYRANRTATQEERKVLARYVGWGGLAQVFDETNEQWSKEYKELKIILSSNEYDKAKGSVLNAHYTSKEVIEGIYAALERFGVKGNNRILEPALGIGNFFGYMPQSISTGAKLYGVELDEVTGKIAAKLYPQAKVQVKGFEETSFPTEYFDIVVSNVPFGGYSVYDSEYSRQKFMIHDYFIAKSIDRVKPNGIVAVVTSKGTLDKLNPTARKYMAERAELLGAIRLPNTAFKQTANTEVVTDILFFQKRKERIADTSGIEWLGTGKTPEGFEVNNYFINHPEMVLGTFAKEMGLYGAEGVTVKPDGRILSEALNTAISFLPQSIYENPKYVPNDTEETESTDVFSIRPMCYAAINGKLYMRVGETLAEQKIPAFPKDAYERIREMISLRDRLRYVLDIQTEGCTDETLKHEQWELNAEYEQFVRKYGFLNGQTNMRLFREDGDAALLFACETLSEDKTKATKADVFTKRTIRPYAAVTHTSDTLEALQICRNERGRVEIDYIEELTDKDFDTVMVELGDTVYRDPTLVDETDKYSGYQTAEDYLSGKVVEKLRIAREYAAQDERYQRNVSALEKMQPEPLAADEISVRIGASWVDVAYYKQFLMQLLEIRQYYQSGLTIRYNRFDGSWKVERTDYVRSSAGMNATGKYGTNRANAFRLFEDCLNQRATSVYDTIEENGKEKQVINQAETIAAREKQNKIREEFADWIYADPNRREDLEKTYNKLFNQIRLPSYDGSFLKFPGMNPAIDLRPHQKNAIARIAGTGNSTLLHHVVGSGKSFTMAASAMKLRQYGLAKKPMIVVPNHLVQQMANEFRKLYPTAKILITQKEDLEKENRKRFVSKVAMGDWDSIIIAQSSFAKIPVSQERQESLIRREIAKVEAAIMEMREESGSRSAVKNLERIKKAKETMLKKLTDSSKKDNVLIFENLGVDYLFVDEADAYKNLFLYTKMNNVSGISNAASARASDMQLKIEYINELHGGDKGVVFATGTPISNSMAEMYVMQTYLQKNTLEELGINYFDGWAADFGETVTALEMAPSGQGYRARTRFAKFTNLPELMTLYRSFADVQTSDMVKLDVPEAERITETLEPSEKTIQIAEEIAKRAERIYNGGVDPHVDNMLKVTSDGKKLALDIRCFDSFLKDEEQGKLDMCAENARKVYDETQGLRGTQLIFCDMSTPKKRYEDYDYGRDFDVYNDLKHKLIERGVPKDEIVFIHDAKTDKEKQALFDKMNEGKIRILLGSTEKCGAGTNVQKRLAALHHLDAPYRPRDLQQRDGRGVRQGNMNKQVKIFTYVTKRTLDSYCYQILENKQKFISQIESGNLTVREAADIDETTLSYAEIKAITAANPKIKRKMELETELTRLRVLEGQYKKNLYALQDKVQKELPIKIRNQEKFLQSAKDDETNMRAKYSADAFSINVLGQVYTEKKEGAAALMDALRANKYETPVAEYGGFRISLMPPRMIDSGRGVMLECNGCYSMEIGDSELGLITRLDNFMRDFPEKKIRYASQLEQLKRDLEVAEEELKKPFEHKSKIETLVQELSEINAELDLNKREEVVIETDEDDEKEEEGNYMALPERGREPQNPEKRAHRQMTERQYQEYKVQKERLPDAVIFIKNGEYYETVGGDAERLSLKYGLATYQKELGGELRMVAMFGYDDLDMAVRDLVSEERDLEIVEQLTQPERAEDFLETDAEAQAIAAEEKTYFPVVEQGDQNTEKTTEEQPSIYPGFTISPEGKVTAVRIKPGMYGIHQETAEMLRELIPVYNIEPNGDERRIGTDENLILGGGHFGVKETDWEEFLRSNISTNYLCARGFIVNAIRKVVRTDNIVAEKKNPFTDGTDKFLETEESELNKIMEKRGIPPTEQLQPYVDDALKEYMLRVISRTPYLEENPVWNNHGEAFRWEVIRQMQRDSIREEEYKKSMSDLKKMSDYFPDTIVFYTPVWDEEEKKYYIYTAIGYSELQKGAEGYDRIADCRRSIKSGIELPHMQALIEMSRYRFHILPEYELNFEHMALHDFRDVKICPLTRRRAQQLCNLGMTVYVLGENNSKKQVSIDGITGGQLYGVDKDEWRSFSQSAKGMEYLTARRIVANATVQAWAKDFSKSEKRDYSNIVEKIQKEHEVLDRFLPMLAELDENNVALYVPGLVKEYAAKFGEELPEGMISYGVEDTILDYLPSYLSERAEELFYAERKEERKSLNYILSENVTANGKSVLSMNTTSLLLPNFPINRKRNASLMIGEKF